MPIKVKRVWPWQLWIENREWPRLWHQHDWQTIRFQHLTHKATGDHGTWYVNQCSKCAESRVHGWWTPR